MMGRGAGATDRLDSRRNESALQARSLGVRGRIRLGSRAPLGADLPLNAMRRGIQGKSRSALT